MLDRKSLQQKLIMMTNRFSRSHSIVASTRLELSVRITVTRRVLGTLGIRGSFREAIHRVKLSSSHQIVQVAVVGAVVQYCIPGLRPGVTLMIWNKQHNITVLIQASCPI